MSDDLFDDTEETLGLNEESAAAFFDRMRREGYEPIPDDHAPPQPGYDYEIFGAACYGWQCMGPTRGGDWNRPSRGNRRTDQPMGPKIKWRKLLSASRQAPSAQEAKPE